MSTTQPLLSFLIVGSPRSGTTLLQRLACELPGVGMPGETHFLEYVVPDLLARGVDDAPAVLREWLARPQLDGTAVDIDTLLADASIHGVSAGSLFAHVVRQLRPDHPIRGEKTPAHVSWWEPLSRFDPGIRFLGVVRDPRAVVASNLAAPWRDEFAGGSWADDTDLAIAEHWRSQQQDLLAMRQAIGDRCLVVRYEDVVADPDGARARIGRFLGVADDPAAGSAVGRATLDQSIAMPWETWKDRAHEPVTTGRVDAWRTELAPARAHLIAALCSPEMRAFGYQAPGRVAAARQLGRLPWRRRRSLRGLRNGLTARRAWIESVSL
jgi:hypothetical protein